MHICYFTRIPIANRLIEFRTPLEHLPHGCHITRIPTANTRRTSVIKRLPFCIVPTVKHIVHIGRTTCVPVSYILIKNHRCICIVVIPKHGWEILHRTHIPVTNRLIKSSAVVKHAPHSCYIAYIPISNRLTKWSTVTKNTLHICYATGIPKIHIALIAHIRTTRKHIPHTFRS